MRYKLEIAKGESDINEIWRDVMCLIYDSGGPGRGRRSAVMLCERADRYEIYFCINKPLSWITKHAVHIAAKIKREEES